MFRKEIKDLVGSVVWRKDGLRIRGRTRAARPRERVGPEAGRRGDPGRRRGTQRSRKQPRTPEGARGQGSSPELASRGAVRPSVPNPTSQRWEGPGSSEGGEGEHHLASQVSGKALGLYLG